MAYTGINLPPAQPRSPMPRIPRSLRRRLVVARRSSSLPVVEVVSILLLLVDVVLRFLRFEDGLFASDGSTEQRKKGQRRVGGGSEGGEESRKEDEPVARLFRVRNPDGLLDGPAR